MKTLREDWSGSFNSTRYCSVTKEEFDAITDYNWMDDKSFSLSPQFHNYDGFVEKSKSGIKGDAYKARKPYPETTIYYILNGELV